MWTMTPPSRVVTLPVFTDRLANERARRQRPGFALGVADYVTDVAASGMLTATSRALATTGCGVEVRAGHS